ncbi:hypothetical protein EC835_11419 [Providencia alcalifaciens]|uniref:Uncharacterized protein n=1 Tax=Providencia alcalifaciens TaxID=126385 RepID=A0A4R3NF05_9GAMM|nr:MULTISPECIES: hypothetical protein [Providencia]MBC5792306.1 hypothetical protein [Providencia sp. JUb39]TCT28888.1 hypothetical protein EC835_11419 [Providencia alcalifaciens]
MFDILNGENGDINMDINWIYLFFELLIAIFIVGPLIHYMAQRKVTKKNIYNGERYSKLEIFKSIERNGEVIYYLGNEKNQIEVTKEYYEAAIKSYRDSMRNNQSN